VSAAQSLQRIVAIARKEIRQLRRDRLTFGMVVGIPVMQILLFGYAIDQDVRQLRAAVADLAGTQRSRALVVDAEASQVVDVVRSVPSGEALDDLLREGRIAVGILVPPDFERRVERGRRPPAHLLVDGSDPVVLAATEGLLELPIERRMTGQRVAAPNAPEGARRPVTFELRPYYNPEGRSAVHIVPGLVGVILTMTLVLFTAVAIVRERERGNLELLITTPVRTPELMLGKIVPYVAIGLIQLTLILMIGRLLFDVPVRGRPLDVYLGSLVFVAASLTLGLVISTIARTQFQAFQLTFFTFLPQILLSGFMFPYDGMPRAARLLAELLPLTHFVRVIRGLLLRGAELSDVQRDLWPLVAFSAIALALSIVRFRKRLD
jgi:ABC-2 type transport system permease protein